MPNYVRNYLAGGTYFFTVVTQDRRPILTSSIARKLLHDAIAKELKVAPFELVAIVLLPAHLHAIWTLPHGDSDYSTRWRRIKERFTRSYMAAGGMEATTTLNRLAKQERAIWQPRFWEHTIRDEDDHERCFDYLHYNPVKHGMVDKVSEYSWSTFHKFVRTGLYNADWGCGGEPADVEGAEWD